MMRLFVWNDVADATNNYHDSGGVVVIAPSLERARELIAAEAPRCEALTTEPDCERDCEGPEYLAIHQDAGCC